MNAAEALERAIRAGEAKDLSTQQFDAIVIGSGAAGGLASQLLCEGGKKVLLLEAGIAPSFLRRPWTSLLSAVTSRVATPELFARLPSGISDIGRKGLRAAGLLRQPVQSKCFAWQMSPDSFVDDRDNPYTTSDADEFTWFRSRQLGGRMIIPGHGRQYYRLSNLDFDAQDDLSPKWPLSRGELDPWYAFVEQRLKLTGRQEGSETTPDSHIASLTEPSDAELDLMTSISECWPDAETLLGRYAAPLNAVDQAALTSKLILKTGAIVREILVTSKGRTRGVRFVDAAKNACVEVEAPIVFLCAGALESTRILMLSNEALGLGGESDVLGANLMDHVVMSAVGQGPALKQGFTTLEPGRCVFLPRFDRRHGDLGEGQRGYGVQIYRSSQGNHSSYFQAVSFSEMTPRPDNRLTLNHKNTDRWGVPTLHISCRLSDQELERAQRQSAAVKEIADLMKIEVTRIDLRPTPPGMAIHECGTARMGNDSTNSVLNEFNECWAAKGLFVTDSSSFPSLGPQNPTLTIMALTARAVHHSLNA